jgi:ElaB/YqjD/DUF883 family membrane-anchored ribosome-binding protein
MAIALLGLLYIQDQAQTMTADTSDPTDGFIERSAQAAHKTIDEVAEKTTKTIDRLQASASGLGEQITDKARAFNNLEHQVVEKVRAQVREHPLTCLLVAVTAGLLIARLTRPSASPR